MNQSPTPSGESARNAVEAFNAAIDYAIEKGGHDGMQFLELWREGDWPTIADEFDDFKGPLPSALPNIESPAERAIRDHNEGCEESCKARRGKNGCGYQNNSGKPIYGVRRCPECPLDWKIEFPSAPSAIEDRNAENDARLMWVKLKGDSDMNKSRIDPVEHTVKLQKLVAEYNDVTAKAYNPDKKKAIKLLNQITLHCASAIDLWLQEEK